MSVLTLTTDFGPKDYYLGALKGALLSRLPDVNIVDISHQVNAFDIVNAAYIIKNCYSFYPENSLHLICVNNHQSSGADYLLTKLNKHWFLAPDNGLLSLISDSDFEEIYKISMASLDWSDFHNRLAGNIHYFFKGFPKTDYTTKTETYLKALNLQPVTSADDIKGAIVHIDNYGNVVSNIHELLFEASSKSRTFQIHIKPNLSVYKILSSLEDLPVGETFSIFNAAGYLTFGVCLGSAAELHGMKVGAIIQIQFDQ